jgi:hypothetical protein
MSNVSNQHSVVPFVAGQTAALSGQRLAKVGYKQTKTMADKGEIAPKSIAVSVPKLTDDEIVQAAPKLVSLLRAAVEDTQDKIIRSLYEGKEYKLDRVSDDEIGINAIVGYVSSEQSGGRLTKEYLESWFDTNLRDNLFVVIADKLGFAEMNDDCMATVDKHLAGYRGLISSLAGGKTMLSVAQITGLRRALVVSSVDDETSAKLVARMDVMEKSHNAELLAL